MDFCAKNNLIIEGTVFPHTNIYKSTLVSHGHRTENQKDHMCISAKFKISFWDERAMSEEDAPYDHFPLAWKLKLGFKKCMQNNSEMRYDIEKLKDGSTIKYFKLLSQNQYQILQDQHTEDNAVKSSW